jgi:hypothetical protein
MNDVLWEFSSQAQRFYLVTLGYLGEILGHKQHCIAAVFLKGLSHEMDLAYDDMYGYF